MAPSGGVSGLAVGTAAAGGLLIWSAIRNVTPLDTLREVLGRPTKSTAISTPIGSTASGVRAVGDAVGGAVADVAGSLGDGGRLISAARRYLGVPYRWAGTSRSGVDCSGLVVLSLRDIGAKGVPRFTTATFGAWAKSQGGVRVGPDAFRAGDIILRPGHMGIAISGTRMIHAPRAGTVVKEADIYQRSTWWGWRLFGAPAKEGLGSK